VGFKPQRSPKFVMFGINLPKRVYPLRVISFTYLLCIEIYVVIIVFPFFSGVTKVMV